MLKRKMRLELVKEGEGDREGRRGIIHYCTRVPEYQSGMRIEGRGKNGGKDIKE
jgi:hypothetical protein